MKWDFLFVTPNLVLPEDPQPGTPGEWPSGIDLNSDILALVPWHDDRVQEIRRHRPVVRQILDSFVTETGLPHRPAVLIANRSGPENLRHRQESIVAFRNAIAISVILRGRAAEARGYGGLSPTWSDTFDFHPAQIGHSGRYVILSPALTSLVAREQPLHFTPSAYLAPEGRRVYSDSYLYRTLGMEWRRQFSSVTGDQFGRSLFRSLEVAFTACAVGAKNQGSIHDYGHQVALWVSAIEILAWRTRRHADFQAVLDLLSRSLLSKPLRARRYVATLRRRDGPRRLNALERAYSYLYLSRNKFLHGNPVTPSVLFTKNRSGPPASLPRLAAIVYRAALSAYLDERHPIKISSLEEAATRVGETFERVSYDEALAELFGRPL